MLNLGEIKISVSVGSIISQRIKGRGLVRRKRKVRSFSHRYRIGAATLQGEGGLTEKGGYICKKVGVRNKELEQERIKQLLNDRTRILIRESVREKRKGEICEKS